MSTGKIYIVVADPGFSFQSEHSAVAGYLRELINGLQESGYTTVLVPASNNGQKLNSGNAKSMPLAKKLVRFVSLYLYNSLRFYSFFKSQDKILSDFTGQLKSKDLVIEFMVYGSRLGTLLAEKPGIKSLVIYDSPLPEQFREMYGSGSVYNRRIHLNERISLSNADHIVCYSPAVKQYLSDCGLSHRKLSVIPCVTWKGKVSNRREKDPLIGFIGSFLKWHKVDMLVRVFEKIYAENKNARLVLIGKGEEWDSVKNQVGLSAARDNISITGFISEKELQEWKEQINIAVMPGTNWYGSPLKLFEYAEAGIPFVAPDSPSVSRLFTHNESALLIDENSPEQSLLLHLQRLIHDVPLRERLSGNASKLMQTVYSRKEIISKFVSIVNNLH